MVAPVAGPKGHAYIGCSFELSESPKRRTSRKVIPYPPPDGSSDYFVFMTSSAIDFLSPYAASIADRHKLHW